MNGQNLAEKYINDHNSPIIKKSELFGSKLFLDPLNEQQEHLKEKCLTRIENILKHDRVDRRVSRSTAEWIPEENLAKVTKITGASADFGTQNRKGKFLNCEETLFLMETNKLELTYKNTPVSIEEAYKNIVNLEKYLSYKKLALQGYKLKFEDTSKQKKEKSNAEDKPETSTNCEEINEEPPLKITKINNDDDNYVKEIFGTLRKNGPQSFHCIESNSQSPDYYVHVPTDKSESFNLMVVSEEDFKSNIDKRNVNVHGLSRDDNVAFYKFYNVNTPILHNE